MQQRPSRGVALSDDANHQGEHVLVWGVAAALHASACTRVAMAVCGALITTSGLAALFFGVLLAG
jgi:hypothetical protein